MSKKIQFWGRDLASNILKPSPSTLYIPNWFKKTPKVNDGVLTAKRCVPFLDSLSAGYTIPLTTDIYVKGDEGKDKFSYDFQYDVISLHLKSQTEYFNIDSSFDDQPYKWINNFHIKTPKGYSTLFIHPMNRTDLPFFSFSGIVDTDKHPVVTHFPFVIKKDFVGAIPAGTPIIQAIPFKREDWKMNFVENGIGHNYTKEFEILNPPFAMYKRNWWSKKRYQ